jgi:hypothetical protein
MGEEDTGHAIHDLSYCLHLVIGEQLQIIISAGYSVCSRRPNFVKFFFFMRGNFVTSLVCKLSTFGFTALSL